MKFLVSTLMILMMCGANVMSQTDQADAEFVIKRFQDPKHENLLSGAMWTVTHHYADAKHINEVLKSVFSYLEALEKYRSGDAGPLARLGGINGFKAKLSDLLGDSDPAVRAYAATLVGITGDRTMASKLAVLLESRDTNNTNYERGRAIAALGMIGATEYKRKIAAYLTTGNSSDRRGAISALGSLGAKEYAKDIAAMLVQRPTGGGDDPSPVHFLVETGTAKDHKPQLVTAMLTPHQRDRSTAAMYALVSVDAKEHATDIARLLSDEFRKEDAAKALALLGATAYTKQIAALLTDANALVRSAAALSLGVLDAKEYSFAVSKLLRDPENFVRPYAAAGIILMKADGLYGEALPAFEKRDSLLRLVEGSFSPIVESKVETVVRRASDNFDAAAPAQKKMTAAPQSF